MLLAHAGKFVKFESRAWIQIRKHARFMIRKKVVANFPNQMQLVTPIGCDLISVKMQWAGKGPVELYSPYECGGSRLTTLPVKPGPLLQITRTIGLRSALMSDNNISNLFLSHHIFITLEWHQSGSQANDPAPGAGLRHLGRDRSMLQRHPVLDSVAISV